MPKPSKTPGTKISTNTEELRSKVLGLGERSMRKSYYRSLQEQVRANERFRQLLNSTEDGVLLMEMPDGLIVDENEAANKLFKTGNKNSKDKYFSSFVPEDTWNKILALYKEPASDERNNKFEYQIKTDETNKKYFELTVSFNTFDDTNYAIIVFRDNTSRKKALDALHESEGRFRSVIEQSKDAIFILFNGKLDLVNQRLTELTGISAEEAYNPDFDFMEFIAPEDETLIKERMAMRERGESPPDVFEFNLLHRNGQSRHIQASTTAIDYKTGIAILGILRDISEQRELEDQLRQAQKIESIGHLAGGIAHDFNNLLTPIIGSSELAMMQMDSSHPLYEMLEEIHETAIRAGDLTRQLLAFSRKQVLDIRTVNLNSLIKNFEKILQRTIREDIKIEIEYDSTIDSIRADISQIEQILMNLFVNAQSAMPGGGTIKVETSQLELNSDFLYSHSEVHQGDYVKMTISDTGTGMDEITVKRIFEPFFTTKAAGEGTGLGLSTVYGIVKQHGGEIVVQSEPGNGTVFNIYLPVFKDKTDATSAAPDDRNYLRGSGTILVAEDQNQVREITSRILKTFGYSVLVASSGVDALEIIKDNEAHIDLLLTDVIMPNMNGRELCELASQYIPNLKVLYMSGYTQDVISHHGVLDEEIDFIKKPIQVEELLNKIKDILNR